MSLFSITGRRAVVTGAAQGIGAAIAKELSSAGAQVIIIDLNPMAEAASYTTYFQCDITSDSQVQDTFHQIVQEFGDIDILVNNAGVSGHHPAETYPMVSWQEVVNVNLAGTYRVCRTVGRAMCRAQKGSIINVASMYGIRAPYRIAASAYAASKAGIIGLTQALSAEWGSFGVRVNAVAPGHIVTDMTRDRLEDPEYRSNVINRTPLARVGRPLDIAGPVVFLASDAAAFITGQTLVIDGGWTTT